MALLDRCIFTPASGGTADFIVSAAVTGYQTPAQANAVNATTYHYAAESSSKTEWEVGTGTYTSATATLARTTVIFSSNGGSKTNFAAAPTVMISALAEDFVNQTITLSGDVTGSGATAITTTVAKIAGTAVSGTTGSTNVVFSNSPTLSTPTLGAATATSINKLAITAPTAGSTLTIADGKTLTASNTLTLTATDSSTLAIGAGGTIGAWGYAGAGASWDSTNQAATIASIAAPAASCLTLTGGTGLTSSVPCLVLTQGWNAASTRFQGIKFTATVTSINQEAMFFDGLAGTTGGIQFGIGINPASQNAAFLNMYNTHNSSNPYPGGTYERAYFQWTKVNDRFSFGTDANGGGAAERGFEMMAGANGGQIYMDPDGHIDFNKRNTATRWTINTSGHFVAADNTYDIGASGATRPRNIYANTSIQVGATAAILTGKAGANIQHGAADAAAPVAQTVSFQSVVAGTSNTAGVNATINGSIGTGTGAGGQIILQTAPAGSTGTAQNALVAALTLTAPAVNMQPSVVVGNQAVATNATDGFLYIPTCAGTPSGTPTAFTGRVAMVYDTTNNKFYIYNGAWKGGTSPGAFT